MDAPYQGGGTLVTFVQATKESSLQRMYIENSPCSWLVLELYYNYFRFTIYVFYDTPLLELLLSGTANLDRLPCLIRCPISLRTNSLPTFSASDTPFGIVP